MAHPKLIETDENANGEIIFYTTTGERYANKSDVLAFIEEHIQPTRTEGWGLTSDPDSRDETIYIPAEEYYSENTEEVDNIYFKEVILNQGV